MAWRGPSMASTRGTDSLWTACFQAELFGSGNTCQTIYKENYPLLLPVTNGFSSPAVRIGQDETGMCQASTYSHLSSQALTGHCLTVKTCVEGHHYCGFLEPGPCYLTSHTSISVLCLVSWPTLSCCLLWNTCLFTCYFDHLHCQGFPVMRSLTSYSFPSA